MKTINISLISIALLIASSCNQENNTSSKTELLTSNIWISDPVSDNFELAKHESDDTWNFSGNKYINSKGSLLSHPNEKDIEGTWKWIENETKLQIEIDNIKQEFDVIELTPTSLKLAWKDFAQISLKAK